VAGVGAFAVLMPPLLTKALCVVPSKLVDQRVVVGADRRGLVVAEREQAVMVLGPPRSGKTSAVVVPNVLAAWGPVLSTSTKPDVMAATVGERIRRGTCWLYDPSGTVLLPPGVNNLRWSPIGGAATWDGALLLARALVGAARPAGGLLEASHWTERAEALLAPMLHAAALEGDDVERLLGWVNRRDAKPALDHLVESGASPTAADLLEGILATEARELSGIWSTASGVLAAYRSDAALASARHPNFDPRGFVAGDDTVYVCASGRHQDLVAPLVVGLVEDVRAAAFERSAARTAGSIGGGVASSYEGADEGPGRGGDALGSEVMVERAAVAGPGRPLVESLWRGAEPPVLLALDEVANIAPLPDLPALVSEGGGQGVLTLACLQDLSQARRRWGPAAEGFGSLFGATVVLPGIGDVRTLEALSVLCGSEEVWVRSDSRTPRMPWGRSRSRTWSSRRQRRLAPDEIARGRPASGLLLGGAREPSWTPLTPWWLVPEWSQPPLSPTPSLRPAHERLARKVGRSGLGLGRR